LPDPKAPRLANGLRLDKQLVKQAHNLIKKEQRMNPLFNFSLT
jgi:hypothetical protein